MPLSNIYLISWRARGGGGGGAIPIRHLFLQQCFACLRESAPSRRASAGWFRSRDRQVQRQLRSNPPRIRRQGLRAPYSAPSLPSTVLRIPPLPSTLLPTLGPSPAFVLPTLLMERAATLLPTRAPRLLPLIRLPSLVSYPRGTSHHPRTSLLSTVVKWPAPWPAFPRP